MWQKPQEKKRLRLGYKALCGRKQTGPGGKGLPGVALQREAQGAGRCPGAVPARTPGRQSEAGQRLRTETETQWALLNSIVPLWTKRNMNLENTTLILSGPWMSMRTSFYSCEELCFGVGKTRSTLC